MHRILVSRRDDDILIICPDATYAIAPHEALRLAADLGIAVIGLPPFLGS